MEQQDKTKLRLTVSTMINASGFAAFFVERESSSASNNVSVDLCDL